MAYYLDDEDKDQDQQGQGAPQTAGQSGIIGADGAPAPSAQGAQAASTPDKSGNFVGLKQYLDANKRQSDKLGGQVAGQIQNTVAGAQQGIGGLKSQFEQAAQKGQIKDFSNAQAQAQGIVNKAANTTAGTKLSDADTNRFKEVSNAQYTGPKTLAETNFYQPVAANVQKAQNYADLSKTEQGNQQLLRDLYKTPNYTQGENRLDSYLLNSKPNQEKLAASRADAGALATNLSSAEKNAADYAKIQKQLADALRTNVQKSTGDVQAQRNAAVQAGLDAQEKSWADEYNQYVNLLNNSQGGSNLYLNPEQLERLGVDDKARVFDMLKGPDAAQKYLTLQNFDANKVIGKNEQAQLAALDQLANLYGGKGINKYTNAAAAGTLTRDQALDTSKFAGTVADKQAWFDDLAHRTNLTGSGAQMVQNPNFTDEQIPLNVGATMNLSDYLRDVGGGQLTDAPLYGARLTPSSGVNLNDEGITADDAARQDLFSKIKDYLQNSGYMNQINPTKYKDDLLNQTPPKYGK